MRLKDIPIQRKLMSVILITCSVVLLLICGAYIFFEYYSFKNTLKNNVSTLGAVIASNSSAALAFDSPNDAIEILNALKGDKHIVAASLYDKNGKLFAKYPAGVSAEALPAKLQQKGYFFDNGFLIGFEPIVQANEPLGTLFIKSDLEAMHKQLSHFISIALLLIIGSLFVAYILSNLLQKSISQPILALEQTAKIISASKDYSIRAVKKGKDEIGSLTETFNGMLSQIESQNLEIIKSREESLKLAAIVESSGDAIIANNLDQIITSWNDSATAMLGYTAKEMIGTPITKLIPTNIKLEQKIRDLLKNDESLESIETQFITKSNELLDVSLTISPVKNSSGNIIGLSQIARDISIQKQSERLLIDREEHLRLATLAAELGTFDMNITSGIVNWDSRCKELLGLYKEATDAANEVVLDGIEKDEKERVTKLLNHALNRNNIDGHYDLEYKTIAFNNKTRWVRVKGKAFFNEEGKPVRFLGAALDITRKKQDELKKNDFIAIISHELKTPLTSIKAYVQILLAKAQKEGDTFRTNTLSRAEAQTTKMTSMIKDFLNLARIEEGKLQIEKTAFDLQTFFENIIAEAAFLTSSHTINMSDCNSVQVYADKDKISQVLINLLSNAVKYSSSGSTINIGCEKLNGHVNISVSDEGIGINPDDQKKLFNRFYRVENEKMKTVSGFGIGLYLVSEILRYHDSKIIVNSTEGVGSTFSFNLETLES